MSAPIVNPFIVAVPVETNSKDTLKQLKESVSTSEKLCDTYEFKLPHLKVLSLEQLINLSDEMQKMDQTCKNLLDKIRRAYSESTDSKDVDSMDVDGVLPDRFLQTFTWNDSRHPHNRSLNEIVLRIMNDFKKAEEELKTSLQQYQDVKNQLSLLQKKRGTNLLTTPLSSVLTHEVISKATLGMSEAEIFLNTDYLQTICIVIHKSQEQTFLSTYNSICDDKVRLNKDPNSNSDVHFSPILPNSAKLLFKDNDDYLLYSVVILKKFQQDVDAACKELKYTIRPFDYHVTGEGSETESEHQQLSVLQTMEKVRKTNLARWARNNFSDCFSSWIHLKCIRLFVECSLRYSITKDFVAMIIFPSTKNSKKIYDLLYLKYSYLGGHSNAYGDLNDADSVTAASLGSTDVTLYPYACLQIENFNKKE